MQSVPQPAAAAPEGWRADPWGQASWRWWDGTGWTGRTAPPDPNAPYLPIRELAGQTLEMDPKSSEWHQIQLDVNRGTEPVAQFRGRGLDPDRAPVEAGT